MAITAAMKKVLSPISETRIMPQDFKKPAARPPASRLVMLQICRLAGKLLRVMRQRQACTDRLLCNATRVCAITQARETHKCCCEEAARQRYGAWSDSQIPVKTVDVAAIPETDAAETNDVVRTY